MGMLKDKLINRMDIAKRVLEPLFYEKFEAVCVEFCVNDELDSILIFVEPNNDSGDKYYSMDLTNAPKEQLFWDDNTLEKYFADAFEVLKLCPIAHKEAKKVYWEFKRW